MFPVSQRINAERALLLAWPRAILLQLAHPLVAAGVADHSAFRAGPLTAAQRLRATVRAMLALTFEDDASRARTIAGIQAIHRRVRGTLHESVGTFPAGTPYSAEDPALVLWVHATIVESMVAGHEALIGPVDGRDRDAYCAEARPVALDLGAVPGDVPDSWRALVAYVERVRRSGTLGVGCAASEVARAVMFPPPGALIWPLARASRLITAGLLPGDVRDLYGYEWAARHAARFDRSTALVRRVRRHLPDRIALWASARAVRRAAAA